MWCPKKTRAACRAPEQRRSSARRLITPLFFLCSICLIAALPLSIVQANDEGPQTYPVTPAPIQPPSPPTATPANPVVQVRSVAPPPPPAAPVSPTAGLTVIGEGGAAFYSPQYDNGGWDAIIRTHMRGGQGSPDTFPYSPNGYYCVHPDFVFGNVLTIQNTDTGKTLRCTVADAVAPWDQPFWRSHFVIEISYALFTDLGLTNGNHVRVWALAQ
ncbi:MAG: hypothetical protein ACR2JW_19060 [Thermomicrobiales bacterium]